MCVSNNKYCFFFNGITFQEAVIVHIRGKKLLQYVLRVQVFNHVRCSHCNNVFSACKFYTVCLGYEFLTLFCIVKSGLLIVMDCVFSMPPLHAICFQIFCEVTLMFSTLVHNLG